MRKFLIPAFILASTLATAAPAAAQWAPSGNAYGYNNHGQARRLVVRVRQLRREIVQLDRRNILSNREARRLDAEARSLEYRIRQLRSNGFDRRERFVIERRIARLEQRIRFEASDGNRRFGRNHNGFVDRDRDGRDDRFEDDRGRDHDGRRDRNDNGFFDRDRDGRDDRFEDDRGRDHDGRRDRDDDRRDRHDDDDDDD